MFNKTKKIIMEKEYTQELIVSESQTAEVMKSGTLPVFATPALVAFVENTAMQLITDLPDGETSVGIRMDIEHIKASAIGENLHCTAVLKEIEGRKYTFSFQVVNASGDIVGKGIHERFVVNKERFMSKL